MKTIQKSVLLWYSAEQMYALVTDIERYPLFLPWCDQARILETTEHGVVAEIGIVLGGVRQTFVTRNRHQMDREVAMTLEKGPFSQLDGAWTFQPVGDASVRACRVGLGLSYGFSSRSLAAVVGPVFDRIAATLVDAFVKRAEQVYGATP
jgi:ribosome-associated toxin RatA of RatAB toxin-antitoxin module